MRWSRFADPRSRAGVGSSSLDAGAPTEQRAAQRAGLGACPGQQLHGQVGPHGEPSSPGSRQGVASVCAVCAACVPQYGAAATRPAIMTDSARSARRRSVMRASRVVRCGSTIQALALPSTRRGRPRTGASYAGRSRRILIVWSTRPRRWPIPGCVAPGAGHCPLDLETVPTRGSLSPHPVRPGR